MDNSFSDLFHIAIIGIAVYGSLYFLGTGMKPFRKKLRHRQESSMDYLDREARILEQEIAREAEKREQKRDKVASIAKQKPERIASAIQKWLLENGGKHAH